MYPEMSLLSTRVSLSVVCVVWRMQAFMAMLNQLLK